jgi:hypothetical protein
MPSPTEITVAQLSRLVGLPGAPVLADVRTQEEFNSDPRLLPGAQLHPSTGVKGWCRRYAGQSIVVLCQSGGRQVRLLPRFFATRDLKLKPLKVATTPGASCVSRWCERRRSLDVRMRDERSG